MIPWSVFNEHVPAEAPVSIVPVEMRCSGRPPRILERCRADGYKVTITVLNRHARTAVVISDDGVNPHTVENSLRKAYTAFTTRSPSADTAKRSQPGLDGFMQLEKITTIEGGLPIFSGKELVGAVGISGAPGGEKDAACAQAGIDKIAKSLGG